MYKLQSSEKTLNTTHLGRPSVRGENLQGHPHTRPYNTYTRLILLFLVFKERERKKRLVRVSAVEFPDRDGSKVVIRAHLLRFSKAIRRLLHDVFISTDEENLPF